MGKRFTLTAILAAAFLNISCLLYATELETQLYETAKPYIKYFQDRRLTQPGTPTPGNPATYTFDGLTRSLQLNPDPHGAAAEEIEYHAASGYDLAVLGRIELANGSTRILDTYVRYATTAFLSDIDNPLIQCSTNRLDGSGNPVKYGGWWFVRIDGRGEANWWDTWDWRTDTGGTACLITYAAEAYQKTSNADYKNVAIKLGEYILDLQDADGGIRYGPIGMPFSGGDPWTIKSVEQNERCEYAMRALAVINSSDPRWLAAANNIKTWLKSMYDFSRHVYYTGANFNGTTWVNNITIASDVIALAPIDVMLTDTFFGSTQTARNTEVDAMFTAAETATAYFNAQGKPIFFKFSNAQASGFWGSAEFSSQMAMGYLKAAQTHYALGNLVKTQAYLDKYYILVKSLSGFFSAPTGDLQSLVAPYSSYLNRSVAGGLNTGIGWTTPNSGAYVASAYYAFAKSGYDPYAFGGGSGIPPLPTTLNIQNVPWYQNVPAYSSTGAASAQMTLNYLRQGAGSPNLTQNEIYEYARPLGPYETELKTDEVNRVMNHFQPGGYHFAVRSFDPATDPLALNKYMRDICHWMAYDVPGVTRQNVPIALPLLGAYGNWVTVKGFATNTDPCPADPWTIPDFTVYGFWFKDPLAEGIGKDTYKTASECQTVYLAPLSSSGDPYNGKYVLVAEPPPIGQELLQRGANVIIAAARPAPENLAFIKVNMPARTLAVLKNSAASIAIQPKKQSWRDMVDKALLTDPDVVKAFENTAMQKPIPVEIEGKSGTNYYLIPFSAAANSNQRLVNAVIIVDAKDGRFKEASWIDVTKSGPALFLNVDKDGAANLIKDRLRAAYDAKIAKLDKKNKEYAAQKTVLGCECQTLMAAISRANAQLLWGNHNLSGSQFKPYWKLTTAYGAVYYVTQEKKIINADPGSAPKITDYKELSLTSGTKSGPVSLLNVDKDDAVNLAKDYLRAAYDAKIAKLDKKSRDYAAQKAALEYKCRPLITAVGRANAQLIRENRNSSGSQPKPYWKLTTADGTAYYVTQEKKVSGSNPGATFKITD